MPTIAVAQLLATSLWFSANSEAGNLILVWHARPQALGWLSSAVQAGFILGTMVLSLGGLADRFRASSIFVVGALAGASLNAWFALSPGSLASGLVNRGLVGVCLAGIYPLGMKLMVTWAPERAGAALAQLVAMLTLGTALPHILHVLGAGISWRLVVFAASLLALSGAVMIGVLGDGPNAVSRASSFRVDRHIWARPGVGFRAFRIRGFRFAALGYFGHMWELYAFWVAVPILVAQTRLQQVIPLGSVSAISFCIIGMGAVGCLVGGTLSRRIGSHRVAAGALAASGLCCATFALTWHNHDPWFLFVVLLTWGATVVADSPQFSAVAAAACPGELLGSALALQNSIGFAITVVAIPAVTSSLLHIGLDATWLLLPGPVLGLAGFLPLLRKGGVASANRSASPPD